VQAGLFRLVFCPGQARAFWAGFAASGVLAALSFLAYIRVHDSGVASESLVSAAWLEYLGLVDSYVVNVFVSGFVIHDARPTGMFEAVVAEVQLAQLELVIFLPQLLAALLGGWLARLAAWVIGGRLGRKPI
jgi:hypothetical protein